MSLWTPDGERPVRKEPAGPTGEPRPEPSAGGAPPGAAPPAGMPGLEDLSPEERARAEEMLAEMAEAQRRIAEAPAAQVVANHLVGFYELAAIHLQQDPPQFGEAAIAIDALRAVLEGLGDRLGDQEAALHQALSQIQMAFVELKRQADEPTG